MKKKLNDKHFALSQLAKTLFRELEELGVDPDEHTSP